MPLEVTPVTSGQEVSHYGHSESITDIALFLSILLLLFRGQKAEPAWLSRSRPLPPAKDT